MGSSLGSSVAVVMFKKNYSDKLEVIRKMNSWFLNQNMHHIVSFMTQMMRNSQVMGSALL